MTTHGLNRIVDCADSFRARPPTKPEIVRSDSAFAYELFSVEACEELVRDRGIRYPHIEMAKNGKRMPPQKYTYAPMHGGIGVRDQAWPHLVRRQLEDGATLIFNSLQRFHPGSLTNLCHELGQDLDRPVSATAYLTPPSSRGLAHHHDADSVFIVQCAGMKTWELHEPAFRDPISGYLDWPDITLSDDDKKRIYEGNPDFRYKLDVGDILWVPRGWIHNVYSQDSMSLHLTIAVPEFSAHRLLRMLVDALFDTEELRAELPYDVLNPERLNEAISTVLTQLSRMDLDVETLSERIREEYSKEFSSTPTSALPPSMVTTRSNTT